jgi:hypothetical protein
MAHSRWFLDHPARSFASLPDNNQTKAKSNEQGKGDKGPGWQLPTNVFNRSLKYLFFLFGRWQMAVSIKQ